METLTLINGNNQQYNLPLPKIVILGDKWNDVALEHVKENTGLLFHINGAGNMEAQPISSQQIVKLFMTYNFKTQYNNNSTIENTILLKSDHHIGFQVDSICYECCQENYIHTSGLKSGDRLMC
jgi:hypothetical protein